MKHHGMKKVGKVMAKFGLGLFLGTGNLAAQSVQNSEAILAEAEGVALEGTPVAIEDIIEFAGTPSEIGQQYGEAFGPQIAHLRKKWLRGHLLIASITGPLAPRRNTLKMINGLPQEYVDEVNAMADASGISRLHAYQANFASDLLQLAMRPFGCSTYVVMPERSETGSMIYGRNLDYFRSDILRQVWTPMVFARKGAKKVLTIGVPGHSGVMTGMNENGVMMSIMVSFSNEKYNPDGIASLFVFRKVLEEASTAQEARDLYTSLERTVPVNVMIADGTDAYVVEAGVRTFAVREPSANGLLYAANHFDDPSMAVAKHKRDKRWDILSKYESSEKPLGLAEVKEVVADAARDNPGFIAQNILGVVVDFGAKKIYFGGDGPVAIEGNLKVIDFGELFGL